MSLVYHYTTIDALWGMLSHAGPQFKDEIVLRASDTGCLNDPQERQYGESLIFDNILEIEEALKIPVKERISSALKDDENRELYEKMVLNIDEGGIDEGTYVVSLSKQKDSLPMWSMYGQNGNGIALGFDRGLLQEHLALKLIRMDDVIYEPCPDEVKKKVAALYRNMRMLQADGHHRFEDPERPSASLATLMVLVTSVGILFKKKPYAYEEEVRIIYNGSSSDNLVHYRSSNGFIVPFVNIGITRPILKEIVFGPTHDVSRSLYSVKKFMTSKGFKTTDVNFVKSDIQYR